MKNNAHRTKRPSIHSTSLTCWILAISLSISAFGQVAGQTELRSQLVPSIVISGPLGSLQQVQYSTNLSDPGTWTTLAHVRLDRPAKPFYDETAQGEPRFYRTKQVGVADTNLVWIPPGTFLMGSPPDEAGRSANEGPQTLVTLTKGFFIGRYEVNNAEWLVYMTNPPAGGDYLGSGGDTNFDGSFYQRAASLGSHLSTIYPLATNYCILRTVDEQQRGLIPPGWFYRLPTEAEWEYACRAGATTPFAVGSGLELRNDAIRQDAAFDGRFPYPINLVAINPINHETIRHRPPVGNYTQNGFGLFDMHGNAMELCLDDLGANLPGGVVTNPVGAVGASRFVGRGGSYNQSGLACRSASRHISNNLQLNGRTGLRVVLIPANER